MLKNEKNPLVIVIGYSHRESVVQRTLKDIIPDLASKFKISFLSELRLFELKVAKYNIEYLSGKNNAAMAYEEAKEVYKTKGIHALDDFIRNEDFIKKHFDVYDSITKVTLHGIHLAVVKDNPNSSMELIETLQNTPNIHYEYIDDSDPSHDLVFLNKNNLEESFNKRNSYMANKIIGHINLFNSSVIVVLVSYMRLDPIVRLIKNELLQIKIFSKIFAECNIDSNQFIFGRTKEEQELEIPQINSLFKEVMLQLLEKYTIPNFTKEKSNQLSETGIKFQIRSQDKNNNAEILIESDLLKKNIRELLEIERKKVTLSSAKEQIKALKNLKLVTIETTSDSKLLLTYPLSLEKEVEKIVMNFEEYKAQQATSFTQLTEETKSNSDIKQQI